MSSLVFSSPRRRRVTGRALAALAVVGAVAATIAFLPKRSPEPAPATHGSTPVLRTPDSVSLTPKRRHAIDLLLDRFLPSALERRNLDVVRTLVTPAFAAGVS